MILARWKGPLAVSFWLKNVAADMEVINNFFKIQEDNINMRFKNGIIQYCIFHSPAYTYPVNILRNRALQLVRTKLVFLVDADFVPSEGLYNYLFDHFESIYGTTLRHETAFVVPAFQHAEDHPDFAGSEINLQLFPHNKQALLSEINSKRVIPMFEGIDPVPHITATNLPHWYTAVQPYKINYQHRYEPYIVAAIDQLPLFDERFIFYGNDKIQHLHHLHFRGFQFMVIPEHFIVHFPHHRSNWGKDQSANAQYAKTLLDNFKLSLEKGLII